MYQITAVFNKHCLNDVLQELYENRIEGVTVTDVLGKGKLGFSEHDSTPDLDHKVMLIIVVSNSVYKSLAMDAIRNNTHDMGHGAGKMWVTQVLEVERIRTGEKNEAALSQSGDVKKSLSQESVYTAIDTPSS